VTILEYLKKQRDENPLKFKKSREMTILGSFKRA